MSALLSIELDRYISIRRSLGYGLNTEYRLLKRFVEFVQERGDTHLTIARFLEWRSAFGNASRETWGHRLSAVRGFAQWLNGLNPINEVPPLGLIPYHPSRSAPYIYSEEEIRQIVSTARNLASPYGLRGLTYATLFAFIAVTGLRISEAIGLNSDEIDMDAGIVTVRKGKGGKMRYVTLHITAVTALQAYVKERDRLLGKTSNYFFVQETGQRPTDCSARYNFALVCQLIGLRPEQQFTGHGRGPRIHDLRHSFAVQTLLNWYRSGADPGREMLKLTTWLGHVSPSHTYWYIEAVPELLALASARVETLAVRGVL